MAKQGKTIPPLPRLMGMHGKTFHYHPDLDITVIIYILSTYKRTDTHKPKYSKLAHTGTDKIG